MGNITIDIIFLINTHNNITHSNIKIIDKVKYNQEVLKIATNLEIRVGYNLRSKV